MLERTPSERLWTHYLPLTSKNWKLPSILGSNRGIGTFYFQSTNIPLGAGFAGSNVLYPRSSCLSDSNPSPLECQGALATPGSDAHRPDSLFTPSDYIWALSGPKLFPPHPTPACFPDTSKGRAWSWRPICGWMPSWMPGLVQGGGA